MLTNSKYDSHNTKNNPHCGNCRHGYTLPDHIQRARHLNPNVYVLCKFEGVRCKTALNHTCWAPKEIKK